MMVRPARRGGLSRTVPSWRLTRGTRAVAEASSLAPVAASWFADPRSSDRLMRSTATPSSDGDKSRSEMELSSPTPGARFIRSGDRFSSPFFLLVTLEALDEPVIDGNFLACRMRMRATGLMPRRFFALVLLPAPEGFSDPIIAGSVVSAARFAGVGAAWGRAALAASPRVFAAFKGAERPIAFENFLQNLIPTHRLRSCAQGCSDDHPGTHEVYTNDRC